MRTTASEDALSMREEIDELADPIRFVVLALKRAMRTCAETKDQLIRAERFEEAKGARAAEEAMRSLIREIAPRAIA